MFKTLLKKQFFEDFKSCFYNPKSNKKRSIKGVIGMILLYFLVIVGIISGTSVSISILFCRTMVSINVGWLYFLIMSSFAMLAGVIGGMLSTFSSLYLSKDNNLLLSMPIPIKYIVFSRLFNVYIMGLIYSSCAILPTIIVYWSVAGITISNFLSNILLIAIISFIVFILSCLLGFVVAKISVKVKNKSFVSVLISLLIIGVYYFAYYKARILIEDLLNNLAIYSANIKGAVYGLYYFGCIGEGNLLSTLIFTSSICALTFLIFLLLKNTFLKIVISTGKIKTAKIKENKAKQKNIFLTLIIKELKKFVSSANYMINCGLGMIIIPIFSILLLIKGSALLNMSELSLNNIEGISTILIVAILFSLNSMNNIVAPSISLEGKNLWILKSLPIKTKDILYAKLSTHFILSGFPMIFALICSVIVLNVPALEKVLFCSIVVVFMLFFGIFSLFLGLKMPIISWTNEITPIKQSGAVVISMFTGIGISIVFAVFYFLFAYKIGVIAYLTSWCVLLIIAIGFLIKYVSTKGVGLFEKL